MSFLIYLSSICQDNLSFTSVNTKPVSLSYICLSTISLVSHSSFSHHNRIKEVTDFLSIFPYANGRPERYNCRMKWLLLPLLPLVLMSLKVVLANPNSGESSPNILSISTHSPCSEQLPLLWVSAVLLQQTNKLSSPRI